MLDLQILVTIFGFDFSAAAFFDWFVQNANYWFVFIFMAIESSFIPFPSELVVPPAAYLAATNHNDLNVVLVVIVATAGALVGSLINYFLALWLGRPIVYGFANSRLGHACLINEAKVQKAEKYFDDHGAISTFIGRLIPAVRQLISIPAGLARMKMTTFCTFTVLGAGIWNCVLAGLGYWLGHMVDINHLRETIEQYNSYLTYAGLALGAICVLIIVWNAFKPQNQNHKN